MCVFFSFDMVHFGHANALRQVRCDDGYRKTYYRCRIPYACRVTDRPGSRSIVQIEYRSRLMLGPSYKPGDLNTDVA